MDISSKESRTARLCILDAVTGLAVMIGNSLISLTAMENCVITKYYIFRESSWYHYQKQFWLCSTLRHHPHPGHVNAHLHIFPQRQHPSSQ